MAERVIQPTPADVPQLLIQVARELHLVHHETGTVVTIEGPRFSSAAESIMFRSWGCHIINMTTVPETRVAQQEAKSAILYPHAAHSSNDHEIWVVLAKEAGLLYAAIALPTDYDSWRKDIAHVDVKQVLKTMEENSERALRILQVAIPRIAAKDWTAAIEAAKETAKESVMA